MNGYVVNSLMFTNMDNSRIIRKYTTLYLLLLVCLLVVSCDENKSDDRLPSDPNKWVCQDSLTPPTQQEIDEWCLENINNLGDPLPDEYRHPPPVSMLDDKNNCDLNLQVFLRERLYDTELGWVSDATCRMTGPHLSKFQLKSQSV